MLELVRRHGWLHITSRSSSLDIQPQALASAASLPPELWPLILAYLRTHNSGSNNDDESRTVIQHCTMVCVQWARCCRIGRHWERIYIRSKNDVQLFVRFTLQRSPRFPRLVDIIEFADFHQYASSPLWLNLAWAIIRCFKRQDIQLDLVLHGDDIQHLHKSIVTYWPWVFSGPTYRWVYIEHIRLRSLREVDTIARAAASCREISLRHVTWDVDEVEPLPLRLYYVDPNKRMPRVRADHCTDNLLVCLLAHSAIARSQYLNSENPRKYFPLDQLDQDIVWSVLRKMFPNPDIVYFAGYHNCPST